MDSECKNCAYFKYNRGKHFVDWDLIDQLEFLRRDPNYASLEMINGTPTEIEARRMAAEAANDMLDDCIAIVKEVLNA